MRGFQGFAGLRGFRSSSSGGAQPDGYDVFLLWGQSNSVGQPPLDSGIDTGDPRIFQYGNDSDTVSLATHPLDSVTEASGRMSMWIDFAKSYLPNVAPNRNILLVPTAANGTSFKSGYWRDGGTGYENMIGQINAAMAVESGTNRLVAVLGHQGESDSLGGGNASYQTDLTNFRDGLIAEVTGMTESTPFLMGQLLYATFPPESDGIQLVLSDLPNFLPYSAIVSSEDLTQTGDDLHFDAPALRIFGVRYYNALSTARANRPRVPDAIDDLAATEGSGQVSLSFSAPLHNHSAITDYVARYRPSAGGDWTTFADGTSTSTTIDVTGLTNGTEYEFQVAAVNGIGQSDWSNTDTATPIATPSAYAGVESLWFLGDDNTSYTPAYGSGSLTEEGAAPTDNSGYISLADGFDGGLRSDIADNDPITVVCVARVPAAKGNGIIIGNLTASATGITVFHVSPNIARNFNGSANTNIGTMTDDAWLMFAYTVNGTAYKVYRGHPTTPLIHTATLADYTPTANPICLGDVVTGIGGFDDGFDFAAFAVWHSEKDNTELAAIYSQLATDLAARGITLS